MSPEKNNNDEANAGYGMEDPAPKARSAVTKPMDASPPGPRSAAPVKKKNGAEWTEWKGLRDAFLSLLLRSVLAIIIWGAIVWALTPLILQMAGRGRGAFLGAVCIAGGAAVGYILSRGLAERAGFVSPILSIMACIAVLICIFAGSLLSSLLQGAVAFTLIANVVAIIAGCGLAVFKTIMDE